MHDLIGSIVHYVVRGSKACRPAVVVDATGDARHGKLSPVVTLHVFGLPQDAAFLPSPIVDRVRYAPSEEHVEGTWHAR